MYLLLLFGLRFIEAFVFSLIQVNIMILFTTSYGYSDLVAGYIVSGHGLFLLVVFFSSDHITCVLPPGIRVIFGFVLMCIGCGILFFKDKVLWSVLAFSILIPSGTGNIYGNILILLKQSSLNRSRDFTLIFVFGNLGKLSAYLITDFVRSYGDIVVFGVRMSGLHGLTFTALLVCATVSILLIFFIPKHSQDYHAERHTVREVAVSDDENDEDLLKSYLKFALLCFCMLGVSLVSKYIIILFPKYMLHMLGQSTWYGSVISIMPITSIFVMLFSAFYLQGLNVENALLVSIGISSIAPFILVTGHSYIHCALFVFIYAIGDCIRIPRLTEFAMSSAPKGHHMKYVGTIQLVLQCSSALAGITSGYLLENFIKTSPPRDGVMWSMIGFFCLPGLIAMFLIRLKSHRSCNGI